jgi:hypothetical protein
VFDDALSEVLPTLLGLRIADSEHIGGTQFWSVIFGNERPTHQFVDSKAFKKIGLFLHQCELGIRMDPVKEVRLLIIVGRKDGVIDDPFEDLSYM